MVIDLNVKEKLKSVQQYKEGEYTYDFGVKKDLLNKTKNFKGFNLIHLMTLK